MAVVRGASAAAGQIVICSGTTTEIVFVDAEGMPTEAPHFCPDCVVSFSDDRPVALGIRQADVLFLQWPGLAATPSRAEAFKNHHLPRAPPELT